MRAVTSSTAAAVLGIDRKAFDNLLGRLETSHFPRGRQGVERRVAVSLLPRLLLATELAARFSVPLKRAFELATTMLEGQRSFGPLLHLDADLDRLHAEVDHRLETAIETLVRPRRGRPRAFRITDEEDRDAAPRRRAPRVARPSAHK